MTQVLRRSQFITTYGPGAILETPNGPRIIPTLGKSDLFGPYRPADFEITDLRLSRAILNNAGILRLPSNAEVGRPDGDDIYTTLPFPSWALCVTHGRLYRKKTNDFMACPLCPPHNNQYDAWRQVRRQAIRFVRACADGHLDDVNWIGMIPHAKQNCNPAYLFWKGGGGSLRLIDIECPNCSQKINLGLAYAREWHCSGRFAEEGTSGSPCSTPAKIIQRGAANLRIPEMKTALTIPPRSTALHRLLEISTVRTVLMTAQPSSKQGLLTVLQPLVNAGLLRQSVVSNIALYDEPMILSAIGDTVDGLLPSTVQDLRLEEFEALRRAAAYGHAPQPSSTPSGPPQFEVILDDVRTIMGSNGNYLRITPVNRLRVVMVQTGYRRMDPLNSVVDRVFDDGSRQWYPGVELFGEGVFIDLAPIDHADAPPLHFPLSGSSIQEWLAAWYDPMSYGQTVDVETHDQLHPVFVWWHTLAHRLINALSIDSGYSSAAVRERVFVRVNRATGQAGGGVLLYTVQPGGDGTLGGLIALVPEFERVLAAALRNIEICSNDPLCGEEAFGTEKYNGAVCYACGLVSETSCEHRNMRLDRTLLFENLP